MELASNTIRKWLVPLGCPLFQQWAQVCFYSMQGHHGDIINVLPPYTQPTEYLQVLWKPASRERVSQFI